MPRRRSAWLALAVAVAVVSGCATTLYCPASSITRGQMMAFLYRASVRLCG